MKWCPWKVSSLKQLLPKRCDSNLAYCLLLGSPGSGDYGVEMDDMDGMEGQMMDDMDGMDGYGDESQGMVSYKNLKIGRNTTNLDLIFFIFLTPYFYH